MDSFVPSPDYTSQLGDDWIYNDTVPPFMPASAAFQGGAFASDPSIAAGAGLLPPYPSLSPSDYMLNGDVGPSSGATLTSTNIALPSQRDPTRFYCDREGCNNTDGFQKLTDLKVVMDDMKLIRHDRRHRLKHDKLHPCAACAKAFGSKADMERHMREVHQKPVENGKPSMHYCPIATCKRHSRGFPRLWNMQQHFHKIHSGVAPSPSSSPTTSLMDTPRFSASEDSAAETPPSGADEPPTPSRSFAADEQNEQTKKFLRPLLVARLKELKAQVQAGSIEIAGLEAELRRLDTAAEELST